MLRQGFFVAGEYRAFHKSPKRVLAAPDIPVPVAAPPHEFYGLVGIWSKEIGGILIRIDVTVRTGIGKHTVSGFFDKFKKGSVMRVFVNAAGTDLKLAPELTAPHADDRIIVMRFAERFFGFAENLRSWRAPKGHGS